MRVKKSLRDSLEGAGHIGREPVYGDAPKVKESPRDAHSN